MLPVKVPCIVSGCNHHAEIKQGKRRLTLTCPNCGPLNFQTNTGQSTLRKWMSENGAPEVQKAPDKSTARPKVESSEVSENVPKKKSGLFRFGVGAHGG